MVPFHYNMNAVVLGLILKVLCIVCALAFAGYALMSNESTLDPADFDGIDKARKAKMVGWSGAAACSVIAAALFIIDATRNPIAAESMNSPVSEQSSSTPPDNAGTNLTPPPSRPIPPPSGNIASNAPVQSPMSASEAARSGPPMAGPTGYETSAQSYSGQPMSGTSQPSPGIDVVPERPDASRGRLVTEPTPKSPDNAAKYPFSPVRLTVTLRYGTEDKVLRNYVGRLIRQAERDSGIRLTQSSDKFACIRLTAKNCIVYADGRQTKLNLPKGYLPQSNEGAAGMALFHPAVRVDLDEPTGHRAEFAPVVNWTAMRNGYTDDVLEVDVFPVRHRVVVQANVRCTVDQQYPDGLPSVFDLEGGQVTLRVLKPSDLPVPKLVELDDVDAHGAAESEALASPMAPHVDASVLSFAIASDPPGSVELGSLEMVLSADKSRDGTYVVTGPITLKGFPASAN